MTNKLMEIINKLSHIHMYISVHSFQQNIVENIIINDILISLELLAHDEIGYYKLLIENIYNRDANIYRIYDNMYGQMLLYSNICSSNIWHVGNEATDFILALDIGNNIDDDILDVYCSSRNKIRYANDFKNVYMHCISNFVINNFNKPKSIDYIIGMIKEYVATIYIKNIHNILIDFDIDLADADIVIFMIVLKKYILPRSNIEDVTMYLNNIYEYNNINTYITPRYIINYLLLEN